MVQAYSPPIAQCCASDVKKQESVFNSGGINTNSLDKPFGFNLGGNRRQTFLPQTDSNSQ